MHDLVIVPTYNERANLPAIVARILESADVDVLVVDDASPDGTGDVAESLATLHAGRVQVLHRSGPRGLGRAYLDGIDVALRAPYARICQMDADFSHDPADLPRLIAATADAALVIGSRYVAGGAIRNWPLRRYALSAAANLYVRTITRLPVRDCTAGFRCWRRETLEAIDRAAIRAEGYAFQVEMLLAAVRRGLRVVEVPITFTERRGGQSKMSGRIVLESIVAPWRLAFRAPAQPPHRPIAPPE